MVLPYLHSSQAKVYRQIKKLEVIKNKKLIKQSKWTYARIQEMCHTFLRLRSLRK